MKKSIRTLTFPRLMAAAIVLACTSFTSQGALLLQYKFNEGTGTTVADSGTGSPADATRNASAPWVNDSPGAYGSSLSSVGLTGNTNAAISTSANLSKLVGMSVLSITGWIKLSEAPAQYDRIIGTESGGFELRFESASKLLLGTGAADHGVSNNANNPFTVGEWVFFAATYDPGVTGTGLKYFTGTTSADSVVQLGTTLGPGSNPTGAFSTLEIAGTPRSPSDRTPLGYFSDFRVYNEVLSSSALEDVRLSAVIPEPSAVVLLAAGFGALVLLRRRR